MLLQVIIMQTPVGRFFKVRPLNGVEWGVSIAIGLTAVPVSIITRLLSRSVVTANVTMPVKCMRVARQISMHDQSGNTTCLATPGHVCVVVERRIRQASRSHPQRVLVQFAGKCCEANAGTAGLSAALGAQCPIAVGAVAVANES
jgi:hypothetical protein